MYLYDLFPLVQLEEALEKRYVRRQSHPDLPLSILNYTERCAFDRAWTPVTRQCRGLIYESGSLRVVARPFPKFFNYGEVQNGMTLGGDIAVEGAVALAGLMDAPAVVTDKMDGSLGILYRTAANPDFVWASGYAIATRGSFVSQQALHATEVLQRRYGDWIPRDDVTYLFEIVYPENRIVLDYGDVDDLYLLDIIDTANGASVVSPEIRAGWSGPRCESFGYRTLAEALEQEPRPNAEGLVVYFPETAERVKIKQSDYVALHRILTGTNARHVWEYAAVRNCAEAIDRLSEGRDRAKCWGSFLGVDPARVAELEAVGDNWLEESGIPDEFYVWVRAVIDGCEEIAGQLVIESIRAARAAADIEDRAERFQLVQRTAPPKLVSETMRLASGGQRPELDRVLLRAWREAEPVPTTPFHRSEAIA